MPLQNGPRVAYSAIFNPVVVLVTMSIGGESGGRCFSPENVNAHTLENVIGLPAARSGHFIGQGVDGYDFTVGASNWSVLLLGWITINLSAGAGQLLFLFSAGVVGHSPHWFLLLVLFGNRGRGC